MSEKMTTPTPRTDAAMFPRDSYKAEWVVDIHFARQLERELAAAQEARQRADTACEYWRLLAEKRELWMKEMIADYRMDKTDDHDASWQYSINSFIHGLRERAQRAEALAESYRQDAERYRWLRQNGHDLSDEWYPEQDEFQSRIDSAIDAAKKPK